jgi:hypothetical protein
MWHPILNWNTKRLYRKKELREAAIADLQAGLSASRARDSRAEAAQLRNEADAIEKSIQAYQEKQDRGFWLCENGHEVQGPSEAEIETAKNAEVLSAPGQCHECSKYMKFIKTELMTGQERYEAKKEKEDAEKIAASKRKNADEAEEDAKNKDATEKHFRRMAAASRETADRLRRL